MTNIASIKKLSKMRALILGGLAVGMLATGASAASSTAVLASAEGSKINIHDGGGPYKLTGYAKKVCSNIPLI